MKRLLLGDVCQQVRESIRPGDAQDMPYIGLESIESGTGEFVVGGLKTPEAPLATSFLFSDEHVLYGKLRPYLNKVAVPHFSGKCSTEIIPLAPSPEVDRYYLAYFLRSAGVLNAINARVAGSRMPRADMKCLLSLPFPYLPLPEQRRIVDILSRAEGIVRLRREAEKKAAELIPALFIEMFGDPAVNPKSFAEASVGQIADVQGGLQLTKTRGANPLELPYLRVANVHRSLLLLDEIKTMRVTESELKRTRLAAGDILIVEGHGNPQEIGRAAIWDGSIPDCVHQNHLIRARLNEEVALSTYVCEFLNSRSGRQSLLRDGKTTSGLSTISVSNVRATKVLIPPIDLQRQFAQRVEAIRALQTQQAAATAKAQASFDALLAQAFPA